jgi:glycosyltransferase involved in cell wall biosynthesis
MFQDVNIEKPDRLCQGAWHGHVVFGQWVIAVFKPEIFVELGTHNGDSYFLFCQAVKSNNLSTQCHAVDTWKGESHAGFYGEDVYLSVKKYNEENYSSFSTLHRCLFDEAVDRFDDNSIDLLHIDGFHSYEAVHHDFYNWLPKLSDNAVVIFHDTNEIKEGFGVHKLWDELTEKYSGKTFHFLHEHGLGVLGIGNNYPARLEKLFNADEKETEAFRNFFSELAFLLNQPVEKKRLALENQEFKLYFDTGDGFSEDKIERIPFNKLKGKSFINLDKYENVNKIRIEIGKSPALLMLSDLRLQKIDGRYFYPDISDGNYKKIVKINTVHNKRNNEFLLLFTNNAPRLILHLTNDNYYSVSFSYKIFGFYDLTNFSIIEEFKQKEKELSQSLNQFKEKLKETKQISEQEVKSLSNELKKKEKAINDYVEINKLHKQNVENLKTEFQLYKEKLKPIKNKWAEIEKRNKTLNDITTALRETVKNLHEKIDEQNQEILKLAQQAYARDRQFKNEKLQLEQKMAKKNEQRESRLKDELVKLKHEFKEEKTQLERQLKKERLDWQYQIKRLTDIQNLQREQERKKLMKWYQWKFPLRIVRDIWNFFQNPLRFYRFKRDYFLIRRSGLFDNEWYLNQNPDLYTTTVDLMEHFVVYGSKEGRNPNPGFDMHYYCKHNPDVQEAGVNPLLHYARYGWKEGRNPSNSFDTKCYLETYPDLKKGCINPLFHYLKNNYNRNESLLKRKSIIDKIDNFIKYHDGLSLEITSNNLKSNKDYSVTCIKKIASKLSAKIPQKQLSYFDFEQEKKFLSCIYNYDLFNCSDIDRIKVSIVLPVYNRAKLVSKAINSVLKQTHSNWELFIVDDGSTDETSIILDEFKSDLRISIQHTNHLGVSSARNVGLNLSTGNFIFYIDSDNVWSKNYLRTMIIFLTVANLDCAYSGLVLTESNFVVGYRGEPFKWQYCLEGNYVDLNVFCHQRSLYEKYGGFNTNLRRMVDWDLILRYTKQSKISYAPFIGALYSNDKSSDYRISNFEPNAYGPVVKTLNKNGLNFSKNCFGEVRFNIAIKISVPFEKRQEWGDYHFAESLKSSLIKIGQNVRIDFLEQWYDYPVNNDHVIIVLRGLTEYKPNPSHLNIIWNISHPDQVSYNEYEKYNLIYVASNSYPDLLNQIINKRVRTLFQCTDYELFNEKRQVELPENTVLFVGNSRNQYRDIVKWAVNSTKNLQVYGTRWEQFIDKKYIKGLNIDNKELGRYYKSSDVVLNDHWKSMKHYGFISNRIFDVLASGGQLISDKIPFINVLFGDNVIQVESQKQFNQALKKCLKLNKNNNKISEFVRKYHSFDSRVEQMSNDIFKFLGFPKNNIQEKNIYINYKKKKKIGLLLQYGAHGPTSSGFIRLICPLTSEEAGKHLQIKILKNINDPFLKKSDVCIIQRVAVSREKDADKLVDIINKNSKKFFIDTDDAFSLLPNTHKEKSKYAKLDNILRNLMKEASGVWFSTKQLTNYYLENPNIKIIRNQLDPRIWRNYREDLNFEVSDDKIHLLYMGTSTHDADFSQIIPTLDILNEEHNRKFDVTIIGALSHRIQKSWLKYIDVPSEHSAYPYFARWLKQQGPFDIGLIPLANNSFNRCKSDIKFLDYSALGLLSVISNLGEYNAEIKDKGLAVMIDNKEFEWYDSLKSIIESPNTYKERREKSMRYLWEERNINYSTQEIFNSIL